MRCQFAQSAERIVHHRNRIQLRLICLGVDDAASSEGVQNKSRDADRVQFLGPPIRGCRNPATAVNQNHQREFLRSRSRQAQLTGDDHRFAVAVPSEKLLIRYSDGRYGMNL